MSNHFDHLLLLSHICTFLFFSLSELKSVFRGSSLALYFHACQVVAVCPTTLINEYERMNEFIGYIYYFRNQSFQKPEFSEEKLTLSSMWADAQHDGRPVEYWFSIGSKKSRRII